jgi:CheY-like chemotaxis protein
MQAALIAMEIDVKLRDRSEESLSMVAVGQAQPRCSPSEHRHQVLAVGHRVGVIGSISRAVDDVGGAVLAVTSGDEAVRLIKHGAVQVVVAELELDDMSARDILQLARELHIDVRVVVLAATPRTHDIVEMMRLGAVDVIDLTDSPQPDTLEYAIAQALERCWSPMSTAAPNILVPSQMPASARWARIVATVVNAPQDTRTTLDWARVAFASVGAIRNWCRMAEISTRRSLVFGRLLRAALLYEKQGRRPEEILDVIDRRTLVSLFAAAGLNLNHPPRSVEAFLDQQRLIQRGSDIAEIRRTLASYPSRCRLRPG